MDDSIVTPDADSGRHFPATALCDSAMELEAELITDNTPTIAATNIDTTEGLCSWTAYCGPNQRPTDHGNPPGL